MVLPFVFLTAFAKRTGMRVISDDVYLQLFRLRPHNNFGRTDGQTEI